MRPPIPRSLKVAVEGCCHGELDAIYNSVKRLEQQNRYKIDLLLVCGDMKASRNVNDVACMAVPDRHKVMGSFYKYYSKEKTAPMLTLVIGGNHEASNYMRELHYGGWLAPNIYYLGNAGCIRVDGVRIASASGIYKPYDYNLGHFEKLPYDRSTMRSIYHTREYDMQKLSLLSKPNIFLSHEWPQDIVHHGDIAHLIEGRPHWRNEIKRGTLGSPSLMMLLHKLKPDLWFSAHMHKRFEATVTHDVDGETVPSPSATKFLALDMCLPEREGDFIEVVDIPTPLIDPTSPPSPPTLSFDFEWLAITRALHPWFSTTRKQPALPPPEELAGLVEKELEWVNENVLNKLGPDLKIEDCQQFARTAPGPPPGEQVVVDENAEQPPWYFNPQTAAFCSLLEIDDKINPKTWSG